MPQTSVRMQRDHSDKLPDWPLPAGYHFQPIACEADIATWCDIWNDAEGATKYTPTYFRSQFGADDAFIAERCRLLIAPDGSPVGTVSAWFKEGLEDTGLIHWVAIRPSQQGKGLSKPMLSEAMRLLAAHYSRMMLTTQAHRLPAIALYLRADFEPMPGDDMEQASLWKQILERLAARQR